MNRELELARHRFRGERTWIAVGALMVGVLTMVGGCSRTGHSPGGSQLSLDVALDETRVPEDRWLDGTVRLTNTGAGAVTVHRWYADLGTAEIRDAKGGLRTFEEDVDWGTTSRADYYLLQVSESVTFWLGHPELYSYHDVGPGEYTFVAAYHNEPLLAGYSESGAVNYRDLAVTEKLPVWDGTSVRSAPVRFRVTPAVGGGPGELGARPPEAAGETLSVRLAVDAEGVVPRQGRLGLTVDVANMGTEACTVHRWRPNAESVEVRDQTGALCGPRTSTGRPKPERADYYELHHRERITFRASIQPQNYGLSRGAYQLVAVYRSWPLVVGGQGLSELGEFGWAPAWEGEPVRSSEVTFRVSEGAGE